MAQIDPVTLQLIVENAMRQNGYSGALETAWQQQIPLANGKSATLSVNLQNLRDAIAQSIFDVITTTASAGSISIGSVQGVPVVTNIDGNVSLNYSPTTNPPVPVIIIPPVITIIGTKQAARVGDTVMIGPATDPVFWAWLTAIGTASSVPLTALSITAKIVSGSSSVHIGD